MYRVKEIIRQTTQVPTFFYISFFFLIIETQIVNDINLLEMK